MIYYEKDGICVRDLMQDDVQVFVDGERAQGWKDASPDKMNERIGQRGKGECVLLAAEFNGEQAGYVALYWDAPEGAFKGMKIPEIVDFNVLMKFRRNGIGTKMLDVCEELAKTKCDRVCLGVGLYTDYGNAQRMYVKRGYVPDGSGVWWQDRICEPYETCRNDDDLVLYLSKDL